MRATIEIRMDYVTLMLLLANKSTNECMIIKEKEPIRELSRLIVQNINSSTTISDVTIGSLTVGEVTVHDSRLMASQDSEQIFRTVIKTNQYPDQSNEKVSSSHGVFTGKFIIDSSTSTQAYETYFQGLHVYFYSDYVRDLLSFLSPIRRRDEEENTNEKKDIDEGRGEEGTSKAVEQENVINGKMVEAESMVIGH
eukprot:Ihof_evm1s1255 gene=Ihof_evmTU1s1255